jgi:hypothetical protein
MVVRYDAAATSFTTIRLVMKNTSVYVFSTKPSDVSPLKREGANLSETFLKYNNSIV